MGKNRKAKPTEVDASMPDECCLPHCGAAGHKLDCGHHLCGTDTLKLSKFVSQVVEFRLSCPMCRKTHIFTKEKFMEIMDAALPFKAAVFKCGCVIPGCQRVYKVAMIPCRSHGSYTCNLCKDSKKPSALSIEDLDSSDDDGPHGRRVPTAQRMAEFMSMERWGLSDEEFERVMRIFKRHVNLTPGNERSYRLARSLGGMPLDFVRDLEASGNDIANMEHTNIYKFVEAVADVVLSREG